MTSTGGKVHLGGRLVDAEAARIDPAERGLLLGDGLFETLLALDGRIVDLEAHLTRLRDSARMLEIVPPATDLAAAARETLAANGLDEGRAAIRITLARGAGPRGLLPPPECEPTLMIVAFASPEPEAAPMRALVSTIRRNERSPLSRLKSLSYLDNVLARREAAERGFDEAIMLSTAGNLACASAANLFLVREGRLMTPAIGDGVLPGIVRHVVLDLARESGIPAGERPLSPADLAVADEAFLTNSLIGLRPLAEVDGRAIGVNGRGPVVERLQRAYAAHLEKA